MKHLVLDFDDATYIALSVFARKHDYERPADLAYELVREGLVRRSEDPFDVTVNQAPAAVPQPPPEAPDA